MRAVLSITKIFLFCFHQLHNTSPSFWNNYHVISKHLARAVTSLFQVIVHSKEFREKCCIFRYWEMMIIPMQQKDRRSIHKLENGLCCTNDFLRLL